MSVEGGHAGCRRETQRYVSYEMVMAFVALWRADSFLGLVPAYVYHRCIVHRLGHASQAAAICSPSVFPSLVPSGRWPSRPQ